MWEDGRGNPASYPILPGADGYTIPEATLLDPPLSTYNVDLRSIGERLANMLIRRCRGTGPERLRTLARATFWAGGSHRPAPGHAANTKPKTNQNRRLQI